MSELRFTPSNIAFFAEGAEYITSSNESYVYKWVGEKLYAIKEYKDLGEQQINLYQEVTALAIPIAAGFITETPLGIITYEVIPIEFVIKSSDFLGHIYTVNEFVEDSKERVAKAWLPYVMDGLIEVSEKVMAKGFAGIHIIPYNTKMFPKPGGILCRITDVCASILKLRRSDIYTPLDRFRTAPFR